MKIDRRIFIGYDTAHPEAFYVCRQSMINCGADPNIIFPLLLPMFEEAGWYWRDDAAKRSTDFTNTRFLAPFMSGYHGMSLFCDSDFLWRKNPELLFDMFKSDKSFAVRVVQHDLHPDNLTAVKMDGKPQSWYPKKNWSSMMLFNNEHPDCLQLTPKRVSEETMDWLHQFKWTTDAPSLPLTFNYLVGYGYEVRDPYAVHFTDGGPWLEKYKTVDYAEEWFRVQQKAERPVYW